MDSKLRHPNADRYEELCALSCIGELSSSDFDELQRHLAECPDCSQLYSDFRRISAQDIGLLAVQIRQEGETEAIGSLPDESGLLDRVLARAQNETRFKATNLADPAPTSVLRFRSPLARSMRWLSRPVVRYGVAALLLCAVVGAGTYQLKQTQLSATLSSLGFQIKELEKRATSSAAAEKQVSEKLLEGQAEREAATELLRNAQAKYLELQAREKSLDAELSAARAEAAQRSQDLEALRTNSTERERQIAELQTRLLNAMQRTEEQRRMAENLKARMESTEEASKARLEQSQSFTESEAKGLLGARDLHIVDVYDVGSNGETKRSYGRVYYAEKRLLIFYAFDLGDRQRDRSPAGFQAWGYSQPNENKPRNLGLFSLEDASLNRWVLEVKNPRVLEHIDAVFVTLESPSGSSSPKGRRLLYANLAVPANHP